MIQRIYYFSFIILLLCSCNFSYPGYKKAKKGIYYKLLKIGEDTIKPKYGDIITVDMEYKTINDSVFFKGLRKFQFTEPLFKGSIDECFGMLSNGDKMSFIISADKFFNNTLKSTIPTYLIKDDEMKVDIEMIEIQKHQDYLHQKKAFLKWIEDFGDYEKVILKQFLEEEKLEKIPTRSGLYYFVLNEGTGKRVELGDTIIFNYEGKFLNGKFFDSSVKRKEPFGFVYGQQWQVIKGLEEGLGLMREGEKALFIVPSNLGWGSSGSSTGIIPPYTSLIFEVEMLSVESTQN